jgi:hypothetical protein
MVPSLILCCAILHNICELHGEVFNDIEGNDEFQQPNARANNEEDIPRDVARNRAINIRNALAGHLAGNR